MAAQKSRQRNAPANAKEARPGPLRGTAWRAEALGRALLSLQLLLSITFFCRFTFGVFEYAKVMVLWGAAIILAALGFCILVGRAARPPQERENGVLFSSWFRALLRDPLAIGVVLFTLSALASTLVSIAPMISFFGANESHAGFLTILCYAVVFFCTRAWCKTPADGRRLLAITVVGAAINAVYSIIQVGKVDPFPGWGNVSGLGTYTRPFASMGHPNSLAELLVMTFPLAAFFSYWAAKQRRWLLVLVFNGLVMLSLGAILATQSRGGWAATAVVTVLLLGAALAGDRRALLRMGVMAIPVVIVAFLAFLYLVPDARLVMEGAKQRAVNITERSTRVEIWRIAFTIFKKNPILGCGIDAFEFAFQRDRTLKYWLEEWNGTPTKAHNDVLQILATQGLLGALAAVVMLYGLARSALRACKQYAEDRPFLVAICAALLGYFTHIMVNFTVPTAGVLFAVFAGVLSRMGSPRTEPGEETPASDSPSVFLFQMATAVLGSFLLFSHNLIWSEGLDSSYAALSLFALGVVTLAVSSAVLRLEWAVPALEAAADGARSTPVAPRFRLAQAGILCAMLAGLYFGVARPVIASLACQRGVWAMHSSQPDNMEALRELEYAVSIDPRVELFWRNIGSAAESLALAAPNLEERRQLMNKALAAPESEERRELINTAMAELDPEGRRMINKAMAAPDAETRRRLIDKAIAWPDPEERKKFMDMAMAALDRAVQVVPADGYNQIGRALIYVNMAEDKRATPAQVFAAFDRALAMDPVNLDYCKLAAEAALQLYQDGVTPDAAHAARYAERGMKLDPNAAQFRALLGLATAVEKRYAEAAKLVGEALQGQFVGPSWEADRATAEDNLKSIHTALKKTKENSAKLEASLRDDPANVSTLLEYGQALESLGRRDAAILQYRKMLAVEPENEDARGRLLSLGVEVR